MADWQTIETAPKDGTAILLCWAVSADGKPIDWREDPTTAGVFLQVAAWWEGDNDWIVYCSMVRDPSLHFKPTHWMHLPDPPHVSGVGAVAAADSSSSEGKGVGRGWGMGDARHAIIRLGEQLASESDAAHDLWTWLPSYRAAQAGHGDYASEHRPSVRDIMVEAAMFIGHRLNPSPEEVARAGDFYKCACGEKHPIASPTATPKQE